MGRRDNIYYCVVFQRYCLTLFLTAVLFVNGIQSFQQDNNYGKLARDVKTTANGFSNVRRITPRVLHKRSLPVDSTFKPSVTGNHLDEISIELPLDSKKVWLDLRLNWDLLPEGHFESFQKNGSYVVHKPTALTADLCHYQGKIRGRPTSWAALSTCNGISGIVFDGDHLHHLEPLLNHKFGGAVTNPLSQWETLHYKHEDFKRNLTCDHGKKSPSDLARPLLGLNLVYDGREKILKDKEANLLLNSSSLKKEAILKVKREIKTDAIREPYDWNEKSRYVEMVIVVDNKKYKELGQDYKQTIRRTKDISNIVNALYAPLNIFIALVGVVVWTEIDEIKLSSNGDDTLANFLHYRRERLIKEHPHDNAQLLTAVEFENGVVGKAMQGPMCSYKFSGGVNSDYKALPGIVATTIAHELGHNFGLAHDGEECKCPGPGGRCIMSASSRFVIYDGMQMQQPRNSNHTSHWSSCSLEGLAYAFDHGMDYCLRNKPKRLYDGPVCGNGFTEPGEECDCGLPDFCKNTCCNAETCTLHKNASCGAGSCCDLSTCHVKAGGTQCRPASNVCDLPEFCSGDSEYCPDDVFKLNGQQCETSNGQAYCYEGKCRTHTDQCILLWGPSGNNSDNLCYQKNNNGSRYGNCGYNLINGTYRSCKVEDTKCGLLHCKYYHEKLEFGYEPVATMSSFFVNSQGSIHPCRSVTVDFGTQDVDPGLVPDGAKCGIDKMCVSQKCVKVETIMAPFKCSGGCGSHGVCNSKGHCHCDDGYGGSSCTDSGFGGSIDSGPAIDPYATSIFAKSLYVTFLGFIPLIAIISFYIYYANDNLKKLCKRGKAVARPQHRNNNKPQGNGSVALRTLDISNPTPSTTSASNNNSKITTPDDFFGKHKGFSLSPLNTSPGQNDSNHHVSSTVSEVIKNLNNNSTSSPSALRSASSVRPVNITNNNGNIQSATNSNVYYSPVPTQTINETLVRNHNNEKPSIKSYTNTFLQKGIARVSWAQPVAQPLPTNSPSSEDESGATSDTPFYDNATDQNNKQRPVSSPDPLNENKQFSDTAITVSVSEDNLKRGNPYSAGSTTSVNEKSRVFSGSHSALSRLAGAFPFVRNSLRSLTSSSDEPSKLTSSPNSKPTINRKNLEISTPILQTESKADTKQTLVFNAPSKEEPKTEDEADYANSTNNTKKTSKGRYANVPLIDESPVKTVSLTGDKQIPKNIQLERIKPENKQTERKPVLRAHSMIQPNRNSIHNGNPNYNSLRRPRPSVPPPKPPEAPPPPPPIAPPASAGVPKARSESPPPITKPKNILRPSVNTSNISSILKFSLKGNRSDSLGSSPKGPAPIAKMDIDPQSPTSPPSSNTTTDNIYDEITEAKQDASKVEEKVETLSTGSSESAGGLLSEIIFEIQNRNKDSIYNSVDRRKKKRENMSRLNEKEKMAAIPTVSATQQGNDAAKSSSSPKSSPKFKYKPAVPAHPILKSKSNEIPKRNTESPPKIAGPATSTFSALGNTKRSSSPLTGTGTPPAYKPTIPLAPVISAAKSISTTVPASPVSTLTTSKPTCAVNGIPKVTSSPSYVAKINYFSNLSGNKNDSPMKPLNSLNSTLSDPKKSVVSNIYAPSSVVTPEPTHLSTIRPTYARPYMNNKLPAEVGDENDAGPRTAGIYSPNSNSEYGTLGKNKGKKIDEKPPEVKPTPQQQPQQQGYKSFNPYLNRPLTFSTFRPNSSTSSATSSSSGSVAGTSANNSVSATTRLSGIGANSGTHSVSSSKATLSMSNPKPITVSVCSVAKKPFGMDHVRDSVGVTSPLGVMRSPTRVVQ